MYKFKQFMMNAQKQKRCPDGYRFDKTLRVCVPIGMTRYYPYYGAGRNGSQQTDTSNNNFSPATSSPLIDAGVVVSGITDQYTNNGSAPDIGAYEDGNTD